MNTMARSDSFHIVGEQIAATLNDAHVALEAYADGNPGPDDLQKCIECLHAAKGALQITEVYGASLLAEEMELTCTFLTDGKQDQQVINEGIEALSRAMVQLPAYVDRIMAGGRDIPLVLLPLLNDLRAARGNPLLSESTLLLLNLEPVSQAEQQEIQPSGEDFDQLVIKLRPQFQLGLLGWIKGGDTETDLRKMAEVAERLERAATTNEVHQLWWVVGGALEALLAKGLEPGVALKRLIGQADREIKRLREIGEVEFSAEPPTDLVNNLLYYVSRAAEGGTRCDAIRKAFNLSDFGPGDEQVEELREQLSAPSAKLMQTVAAAIREDLGKAKDILDIYMRTGMRDSSELKAQVGLLRKISDTLGVLGLGALRDIVQQRSQELEGIVASPAESQETQLVSLAASLLEVETRLDGELLSQVRDDSAIEGEEFEDAAFHQVAGAVLRECSVNLSRIKEAITHVLAQPADKQPLDGMDEQLSGISAGLMMLGKSRAVDLLGKLGLLIHRCLVTDEQFTNAESMNRLADAVVSLEYYMETMQAGRKEPVHMLDDVERSLAVIEKVLPVKESAAEQTDPLPADTELSAADSAAADVAVTKEAPAHAAIEQARSALAAAPVIDTQQGHPDPELLELFIEEAREEIVSIGRHFPAWAADPLDEEALVTIRRSLHTLKGSGRMVGAMVIGEYCWNLENLLNRLLNKTVNISAPVIAFLGDAVEALPQLLEQLEVGAKPAADLAAIVADAASFSVGETSANYTGIIAEPQVAAEPEPVRSEPEESAAEPEKLAPQEIDPVLLEILGRETAGHVAVVRKYLDDCLPGSEPYEISEEMHHACHTLHGSITMANALEPARLTGPLYQIVEPLYRRNAGLGAAEVSLIRTGVTAVETMVAFLLKPEGDLPDVASIEAGLVAAAESIATAQQDVTGASGDEEALRLDEELPVLDSAALLAEVAKTGVDIDLAEPESTAATPVQAIEFDAEIAEIFAEEAVEILESSDAALALLAQNSSNRAPLEELQRHLHTLKGGARMAGITTMGDFSHELESLLLRIIQGGTSLNDSAFGLLQTSFDELHRMCEEVPSGVVAAPGEKLMARLVVVVEATMMTPALLEKDIEALVEADKKASQDAATELDMVVVDEPAAQDDVAAQEDVKEVGSTSSVRELKLPEPENLGELARELTSGEPPAQLVELPEELLAGSTPQIPVPDLNPRRDMARIDSAMLEDLLNNAGEISISHSRLNQQVGSLQFNLQELGETVQRLQGQLRNLEGETEAQILFRHQSDAESDAEFDPLELDRYSTIQQLSRGLAETASDVSSIKDLLLRITSETESILGQQARTTSELQDSLMRTRMVPFNQHVPRLSRLVRQQAQESGKRVELVVEGSSGELDRQVMEKMLPPFEHMVRNAIIHGIEAPDIREAAGKSGAAKITIKFAREGSQVLIEVADDGAGLNLDAIREKAVEEGVIKKGQQLTEEEASQLILRSGLTTADKLTQSAGRGIGMDVVVSEIAKLGGTLAIETEQGIGCKFLVRLPYTLAITQAFIVNVGAETFALPLPSVEGVVRISREEYLERIQETDPAIEYGGDEYKLRQLGLYLGMGITSIPPDIEYISVILVAAGKNSTALVTDSTADNREIVVKPISPLLASIRGIAGATILGDGRVVVILDAPALVRSALQDLPLQEPEAAREEHLPPLVLVVDDSITMRRVTQRLLERNGMRVITAKDGIEALEVLKENHPEVVLLDVEMPRMDGYEFAGHVRNTDTFAELPIIMVTSRTGEKHRARAIELGVNDYLGKPYQEADMLEALQGLLGEGFNQPKPQRSGY